MTEGVADRPARSRAPALRASACALAFGLSVGAAAAEAPLSAIDWLSESVSEDLPAPTAPPAVSPELLRRNPDMDTDTITVRPLGEVTSDALGLLPSERAGLPADLWGATPASRVLQLLRDIDTDALPAATALVYRVLLAEQAPPRDMQDHGALLLARIDMLLDLGALDQAMALMEMTELRDPAIFRRYFDAALLLGMEERACTTMRELPALAPTYPARVFCMVRTGDWAAAALTLRSAQALDLVTEQEAALLERFLDPELDDAGEQLQPPPATPSPLIWRIHEAVGEPLPTRGLPLAFAHADLRAPTGWKAQIEAAERLTRSRALTPNRLLGLYTARRPAASGGVWDRASVVQQLEAAIADDDRPRIGRILPEFRAQLAQAELEVPMARLYGASLVPLAPQAARGDALRIGLLSDDFEALAQRLPDDSAEMRFLAGLARGAPPPDDAPSPTAAAIAEGFAEDPGADSVPAGSGATLLEALTQLGDGARGDLRAVADALAALRALGLETTARQAALQIMILERRD